MYGSTTWTNALMLIFYVENYWLMDLGFLIRGNIWTKKRFFNTFNFLFIRINSDLVLWTHDLEYCWVRYNHKCKLWLFRIQEIVRCFISVKKTHVTTIQSYNTNQVNYISHWNPLQIILPKNMMSFYFRDISVCLERLSSTGWCCWLFICSDH